MTEYTHHIPAPCDDPVLVIYSDEHILVVNKPAGLLSVPGRFVKDCVLKRMLVDYPGVVIVHRLDLDTSGLLVLALSRLARSDINRQFRERLVQKQYVADVFGCVLRDEGVIDLPIGPDPHNRPRQLIDHGQGKSAITRFEVVSRTSGVSRLLLKPETGRSHQLRIHLASIDHPILGCDLYAHEAARLMSKRLCLHAQALHFTHPESAEQMCFEVPTPF